MTRGKFEQYVKECRKLLKSARLLRRHFASPANSEDETAPVNEPTSYAEEYRQVVARRDYDYLLDDEALLRFDFTERHNLGPLLRYSYYCWPYEFPTYREYLKAQDLDPNREGDALREQYEQELSEAPEIPSPCSMRYDFQEELHREGTHSASHLHIGYANSIRLPSDRMITPVGFVVMLIRHLYYQRWKKMAEGSSLWGWVSGSSRAQTALTSKFHGKLDEWQMHLTCVPARRQKLTSS